MCEWPGRWVASSSFGGTSFAIRRASICLRGRRRDFSASRGVLFNVVDEGFDRDAGPSESYSPSDSPPNSPRLSAKWLPSPLPFPFPFPFIEKSGFEKSDEGSGGMSDGANGGRDILRARDRGEEKGDVRGDTCEVVEVRVSRIIRIDRTMFS